MLSYQSILRNELSNRKRKNNAYSLRSFARDLQISQSFLTQVLSQKRKLSDDKAILISEKLKLRPTQKKIFVNLVRLELARNSKSKKVLQEEISILLKKHPQFTLLSEDTFNIVADWYYFAILELTTVKGFKSNAEWIAKKLDISVKDVQMAIERLKRVGLLAEISGQLKKVDKDYLFENIPSVAIKKHHIQTLELARKALLNQPLEKREFFTISFPLDPQKLLRAKQLIREFSEKLMAEMQESEPKSVYKLAIQFFRLDQSGRDTE